MKDRHAQKPAPIVSGFPRRFHPSTLGVVLTLMAIIAPVASSAQETPVPREGDAALEAAEKAPEASASPIRRRVVEEIVVTANRRTQNVQDIAGGIRVFDGEALEKAGTAGLEGFVFQIPGADLVDDGANKKLSIRGVSNMAAVSTAFGGTSSPIGLYLNDTPIQGNGSLPDMDLYDLQRIEVLKGPQGTLYGEGAQGGAFKMLLTTADPSELSAKGEVGVGQTENGSGINHSQKAALNVPLFGSWATRVVATRRVEQGFVDYFNRGTKGENDATNLMGRIHLDGDIWEGFSASAMLLHQRQRLDQFAQVQFAEGDLQNRHREPQFVNTDFTLVGLTLDYDLGFATATSSSSAYLNDRDMLIRTPIIGAVTGAVAPNAPSELEEEWAAVANKQFGFAQELRLVSSGDSWLDWTAGIFYRTRSSKFNSQFSDSETSQTPPPVGPNTFDFRGKESFDQVALFGEATVELPWQLELTLGLRGFREEVGLTGRNRYGGVFYALALGNGPDATFPTQSFGITTTALSPKASLSWFADDSRMLFLTIAQGVRSGGTNVNSLTNTIPPLFKPDTLWSYEVGAKTQWLDGLVTANVSFFYNDWTDLQVLTGIESTLKPQEVVELDSIGILNAGRAVTKGAELELVTLPLEDLLVGFNLFVGDGQFVEGDELGNIPDNTPLPQLPKLSTSAVVSYTASRWPLFGFTPSFQFDAQSTGSRTATPPSTRFGSGGEKLEAFYLLGAQLGFASEHWEVNFSVNNLMDVRQQLGANSVNSTTLTVGRPRTLSARLAFRW